MGPPASWRVKLMGNYWQGSELWDWLDRQSQGDGRWGDVETVTDGDADYYAIVNFPRSSEDRFEKERTIVFHMEPRASVSGWGEWAAPDPREYLQVRSHDRFPNNLEWHLDMTYEQLKTTPIVKTRTLSSVTSGLIELPGQRRRVEFLEYLEHHGTSIDLFGTGNPLGLASYRGPLPSGNKNDGILPYRYTFAAENSAEPNYFTEKIVDAILGECLCFYWGCTNLERHIDPEAFVRLPLEDFELDRYIIERAIGADEWSRRLPAIREAKRKLLDEQQFFPTLARVVGGHVHAERLDVHVINPGNRSEQWEAFRAHVLSTAGQRFLDRCGRTSLDHLGIWKRVAEGDAAGALVLEDDATLSWGFWGDLVEVCGLVQQQEPSPDLMLLGSAARGTDRGGGTDRSDSFRIQPVTRGDHPRGSPGYVVSRAGARRLIELAEPSVVRCVPEIVWSDRTVEV